MIVHDYAGNSKVYTVRAPGNPDDHGTITPTNILWTENFNEKWLPDDWSVQSKGGSLNTWYRDEDYMAAVDQPAGRVADLPHHRYQRRGYRGPHGLRFLHHLLVHRGV